MLCLESCEEAESTVRGKKITWGGSVQNLAFSFGNLSAEENIFCYLNGKYEAVIQAFSWIHLESLKIYIYNAKHKTNSTKQIIQNKCKHIICSKQLLVINQCFEEELFSLTVVC